MWPPCFVFCELRSADRRIISLATLSLDDMLTDQYLVLREVRTFVEHVDSSLRTGSQLLEQHCNFGGEFAVLLQKLGVCS